MVFPALTLNYLAQGSLILRAPDSRTNPFFLLIPDWTRLPMVLLATPATVIASQAVISGAFCVSREAMRLGFLPHLRIRQTSQQEYGQIYVPAVNWGLFAAVLLVVFAFGSSTRLATAYGVAVTGTFLITTTLFLVVARVRRWWSTWRVAVVGVVLGTIELTYFTANLTKVRPEDERHDAEDVVRTRRDGMRIARGEDGLQGVDRAGADVAEDDPERAHHRRQPRAVPGRRAMAGNGRFRAAQGRLRDTVGRVPLAPERTGRKIICPQPGRSRTTGSPLPRVVPPDMLTAGSGSPSPAR